jgi:hypothetical protein
MREIFSNIRNQNGRQDAEVLIVIASVGILAAILVPNLIAHVKAIRARGGPNEAVWIACFLWLGSPFVMSALAGLVNALFRKWKYQEKISENFLFASLMSLSAISGILLAVFIIFVVVKLILRFF